MASNAASSITSHELPIASNEDLPYIETLSLKRNAHPSTPNRLMAAELSTPNHTKEHFKVPTVLSYNKNKKQPPPPPPPATYHSDDPRKSLFEAELDSDDEADKSHNYSFDSDTYDGMFYNSSSSSGSDFESSFDESQFSTPSKNEFEPGATLPSGFLLPPQSPEHEGKMCVVLDMDETLVHSEFLDGEDYMYRQEEETRHTDGSDEPDFFLDVCDGVAVRVRPGLTEFLQKLSEHFEVGVFTAAEEVYACPVLDTIDPTGLISFRLYRDATVEFNNVSFVKDLSRLGRDMRRTVLIDNNIQATLASPDNSLICQDYYGDPQDNQLPGLMDVLMDLDQMTDIRGSLQARYLQAKQEANAANPWASF